MTGRSLAAVDAAALRAWCRRSAAALAVARTEIDALNVFPVPDGDTGSNLLVTLGAAAEAAESAVTDHGGAADLMAAAAAGSLVAARGNSGVIASRFLHGFAAGLGGAAAADGVALQAALTAAADAAYAAVTDPVEGTIVSVARAAAKVARDADPVSPFDVVTAAAVAARAELALTATRLPALAAAGVVDAGGQGLVVILDALADAIAGVTSPPAPRIAPGPSSPVRVGFADPGYEVHYLLDAPEDAVSGLRERLAAIGDAVAIASGEGVNNVHVHVDVDDVGAAIEAGLQFGRPHAIRVTRLVNGGNGGRVIALCPAGELAALYRAAGSSVVEVGDADIAVADALMAAIDASGAESVVLLPNSRGYRAVADEVAALARSDRRDVAVVPTRSPVQGLAALAVHDPRRRPDDDLVAMSAAAAATRYAEVARATYDALTSVGPCHEGDVLGLIDDDVATIGDDIATVGRELLDRMLMGGGELVTVIFGADVSASLATELADYVRAIRPAVDTVVHHGGQPTYPLMFGVE